MMADFESPEPTAGSLDLFFATATSQDPASTHLSGWGMNVRRRLV
jgi:hypothetical protein